MTISNGSRDRIAIFYFFAEIFDIKLNIPPKKATTNENRYKPRNNEFNRKSSLDTLDILAKNLCLEFQVNRIKIGRVRGDGVFC